MSKKILAGLVVFFLVISAALLTVARPYYQFLTQGLKISPLNALLSNSSVKQIDGSVNILVLGIPGGKHDGPNLSDSILVLNYNFKTNKLVTIGIPRDIWSETLKDKINTAYAYGEAKQEGGGLKLAKAEAGAIVGMPIQYSMVIDFNKFKELIDYFGGIDIEVENSFTDRKFPIEGKENDECGDDPDFKCRYETIVFKRGQTHMDGNTALKFVRSRNAEGDQGSDFARSRRQQLVLSAIKEEMIKIVKTYDIGKIEKLYAKLNSLISRDITNQQIAVLARNIFFGKSFSQKNVFLPEDMFVVPEYSQYDGKYVLIPETSFNDVFKFVVCLLEKEENSCLSSINKGKDN